MKKYLLDTNICIYIIKNKPKKVFEKFKKLDPSQLCISSITMAELEFGVFKSSFPQKNQIALTKFLSPITILPFDDNAAFAYGALRASLEQKGKVIGAMDLLIAAHAISEGITLVTNNEKEFNRIKTLQIQNWTK